MLRFHLNHWRAGITAASLTFLPLAALAPLTVLVAARPAQAIPPVRGVVSRKIEAAPAGADAVRISIFGDKSGAKVQVHLLEPGEDGVLTGYWTAPPVAVDFEGWKTVTLPLSDFTFNSDTNPDATQDGFGGKDALSKAESVQIAVTARDSRLFFADLGWTTAAAAPTDALLAPMGAIEESAVKEWKIGGDYSQVQAVSFGVNKIATFQKDGKPTLQMIVRNTALNERQINQPVVESRLKARPTQPYFIYTRAPFDTILPESVPSFPEVKAGPAISLFACPDDIEPASFAVYAGTGKALKNATVKIAGPLATATKVALPATALDIRVVRVGEGLSGPQILMKDDREALTGPLPTVRLTGDPKTDVPGGTSKQFWITVAVSKNQQPGTYKGTLIFSADGVKPTSIPISVEVLDLPMRSAFLQYGMDFRSLLAAAPGVPGGQVVTPEIYAQQLVDIRDHGFKNLMLHDKPEGLGTAFKLYKEAGLNPLGPVIAASVTESGEVSATEGLRTGAGLTNEFAIYYKLPNASPKAFSDAVQSANRNARLIASVESKEVFKNLSDSIADPSGDHLAPIYPMSADYSQQLLNDGRRPITVRNVDYWNWNIALQNPVRNRLFAGFLLYSTGKAGSGVYGAFAGPYQYVPEGVDPFAALAANVDPMADPKTLPQMITFPVQGGMLSTIQWEAVREGVDDVRYIGILKGFSRDLKDLKIRKDATDFAESYLSGIVSKQLMSQTPEQMQNNRRGILRETLKLKAIIQPPKPAPKPAAKPVPAKPTPAKPAPKKKG